jgi:hypothetical protein
MNNKTPSHSIDRLLGPVGWIGWIVALTLAAILNLRIWIETTMLFVTISAVVVALIILLMIYRRKEKQGGEITPPSKNVQVPHEAFEKLLAQVTDLRIAFRAVAYIGSVLLFALSFLGYTTIKDVTSETKVAAIRDSLDVFQDSLKVSIGKLHSVGKELTDFENLLQQRIVGILNEELSGVDIPVPNFDTTQPIPISMRAVVEGNIVLGAGVPVLDGTKHNFTITWDVPHSVINQITLPFRTQTVIERH